MQLRQNQPRVRVFSFLGVSITSLSVTISKGGNAFAAVDGAGIVNIAGNFYAVVLSGVDTDTLGDLAFRFTDTVLNDIAPDGSDVDDVVPFGLTAQEMNDISGVLEDGGIGTVIGDVQGRILGGGGNAFTAVGVQADIPNAPGWSYVATLSVGKTINGFSFLMTDSTNHAPATGKTVTGTISKAGATFVPLTNSPSEVSDGVYKVDLSGPDDMEAPCVILRFTATGCDDTFVTLALDQVND